MNFRKMHGLGNDFVIMDARVESVALTPTQIIHICDRNFGIGCDLLALIECSDVADVFAKFYNADGTESDACGNASRCIADIVMKEQGSNNCALETKRGILNASRAENEWITVDMGSPQLSWSEIPLAEERDTLMVELGESISNPAVAVGMGNPHCVLFVDDVERAMVERLGPIIEHHSLFPQRTNVEFVEVLGNGKLRQRTWERGVGETLACGSGACASGVATIRRGLIDGRKVEILLNGGSIHIEWRKSDNHVLMTGPATFVFEGKIDL